MPVCPKCSRKSSQIGEMCACGSGYAVRDGGGDDPIGILGTLVMGKYIPVAVLRVERELIEYEVLQRSVDWFLTLGIAAPEFMKNPENAETFRRVVERCALIKQQNIPTILDVFSIPELQTMGATSDARKGEPLSSVLASGTCDFVALMHIAHQILQAFSALHRNGLPFPGCGMQNVFILSSGGNSAFVKLRGFVQANLNPSARNATILDDVFQVGQLVLSIMTGQPLPITSVELPKEKAFLLPIVQLFMRACAPEDQRYPSCTELLYAFEAAFDLNSRPSEPYPVAEPKLPKTPSRQRAPLTPDQIAWMHRPPQREN